MTEPVQYVDRVAFERAAGVRVAWRVILEWAEGRGYATQPMSYPGEVDYLVRMPGYAVHAQAVGALVAEWLVTGRRGEIVRVTKGGAATLIRGL